MSHAQNRVEAFVREHFADILVVPGFRDWPALARRVVAMLEGKTTPVGWSAFRETFGKTHDGAGGAASVLTMLVRKGFIERVFWRPDTGVEVSEEEAMERFRKGQTRGGEHAWNTWSRQFHVGYRLRPAIVCAMSGRNVAIVDALDRWLRDQVPSAPPLHVRYRQDARHVGSRHPHPWIIEAREADVELRADRR